MPKNNLTDFVQKMWSEYHYGGVSFIRRSPVLCEIHFDYSHYSVPENAVPLNIIYAKLIKDLQKHATVYHHVSKEAADFKKRFGYEATDITKPSALSWFAFPAFTILVTVNKEVEEW